MNKTAQSKKLYEQAEKELSLINETWEKPEIADLAFLFCHSVKECMYNFLSSYLLMKKGTINEKDSLGDLVNQCSEINERFRQIDLRWLNCKDYNLKSDGDLLCDSADHTKICIWIANGIKKVIDDEMTKQ